MLKPSTVQHLSRSCARAPLKHTTLYRIEYLPKRTKVHSQVPTRGQGAEGPCATKILRPWRPNKMQGKTQTEAL